MNGRIPRRSAAGCALGCGAKSRLVQVKQIQDGKSRQIWILEKAQQPTVTPTVSPTPSTIPTGDVLQIVWEHYNYLTRLDGSPVEMMTRTCAPYGKQAGGRFIFLPHSYKACAMKCQEALLYKPCDRDNSRDYGHRKPDMRECATKCGAKYETIKTKTKDGKVMDLEVYV